MHRKKKDFIVIVVHQGIIMIAVMIVITLLMTIMSFALPSKDLFSSYIFTEKTADASILDKFRKNDKTRKTHQLKISTKPQQVTAIKVNSDNTIMIRGKNTYPKRVSLYLITFPPAGEYEANEAHQALKRSVMGKHLWVSKDPLAQSDKQVYLQTQDDLIQEKLLQQGLVSLHNYNGSEKYYTYLLGKQQKAQKNSKGVWYVPGYVTDTGYNKGALKKDEK